MDIETLIKMEEKAWFPCQIAKLTLRQGFWYLLVAFSLTYKTYYSACQWMLRRFTIKQYFVEKIETFHVEIRIK